MLTIILRFLRTWTLPLAMLSGVALSFLFAATDPSAATRAAVDYAVQKVAQPVLMFCMLFIAFCRVAPHDIRFHRWQLLLAALQVVLFLALAALAARADDGPLRLITESAMICLICPTANAASVVTLRLGGDASTVVSYTCLINVVAAVAVSAVLPLLSGGATHAMGFIDAFMTIMGKVFPLLVLPLLAAWAVRLLWPRLLAAVQRRGAVAFYLWAVALTLAIAVTTQEFVRSGASLCTLGGIAAATAAACAIQFATGRVLGRRHGHPISGAQSMGQKNTVFAIWMGYTFLDPVTSLAGGFYSVWHNVVNAIQLRRAARKSRAGQ